MNKFISNLWADQSNRVLIILALVKVVVHLLTSSNYSIFRDEFYYIAASKRLDFGYVDFPPFIALLTAFIRATLGESQIALRLFPALAGAAQIILTGLMARRLGANRFGQTIAALAVLVAPQYLGANALLSMDSFDILFWCIALFVLLVLFQTDNPKLWLVFGLVAGIGLTIKVTMLYLAFAMVLALLFTPYRKYFRSLYLYVGGVIAVTFLIPYIIWNANNGWPTIEFWGNYSNKVAPISPLGFLLQQVVMMQPVSLLLWLSGLVYCFSRQGKDQRPFGWMYVILLLIFIIQNAKNYFLAPFYPILFATGVFGIEQFARLKYWNWLGWVRRNYMEILVIAGIFVSPMAIPILPLDWHLKYLHIMGFSNPSSETHEIGIFPQHFADRFGWEELAALVSKIYTSLPENDRANACVYTENYGEAGSLEFYANQYDLPPVISEHNNYFLWGYGRCTGEVVIYVGDPDMQILQEIFADISKMGETNCDYCMPYENHLPIYILKNLNLSMDELWLTVKKFD